MVQSLELSLASSEKVQRIMASSLYGSSLFHYGRVNAFELP